MKAHFVCNFFSENRAVYEIMWRKCCRAERGSDGNMARGNFMLYT